MVYHTTSNREPENLKLKDHIQRNLDNLLRKYPNALIVITGDFNPNSTGLKQPYLTSPNNLKQLVTFNTRESHILDWFLTNRIKLFTIHQLPKIASSDHYTILAKPISINTNDKENKKVKRRDMKDSNWRAFGRWVTTKDWTAVLQKTTCEDKFQLFLSELKEGIDFYLPEKIVIMHQNDRPWMTKELKSMIKKFTSKHETSSRHRKNLVVCAVRWIFCATIIFWLLSRSIPMLVQIDANKSQLNFTISPELTSLSERLSCLWTSTRDKILRKQDILSYHRYGLQFEIRNKNLHLLLCILLAGDIATNPGLNQSSQSNSKTKAPLKCLLINARSLKSQHKQGNEISNNIARFQDLVYSEDNDIICVTETWLNSDISNSEILNEGYEIFRKDRESRGGGVLVAIKEESFKNIGEIKAVCNLEIVIVDVLTDSNTHLIVCSCYRPPQSNEAWLTEFSNLLADIRNNYDDVILAGDFNLPNIN